VPGDLSHAAAGREDRRPLVESYLTSLSALNIVNTQIAAAFRTSKDKVIMVRNTAVAFLSLSCLFAYAAGKRIRQPR
jgi:hypothetical protein